MTLLVLDCMDELLVRTGEEAERTEVMPPTPDDDLPVAATICQEAALQGWIKMQLRPAFPSTY